MPLKRAIVLASWVLFVLACREEPPEVAIAVAIPEVVRETREVALFFESPNLLLVPELRQLEIPGIDYEAAGPVLEELIRGPSNPDAPRLLPEDTEVLAVYFLPNGFVVVDLGGTTLAEGWNTGSHEELMAVYGVVQTLVENFESAQRVRILVNGQPSQTLAGHIAIDRFLPSNPAVLGNP